MSSEMCINTDEKFYVNEITQGWILDKEMKEIYVVMKILEEITYDEYYKFVKERELNHLIRPSIHRKKFYRVQILD